MKSLIIFFTIGILISCSHNVKRLNKIDYQGYHIVGDVNIKENDTIFNGLIKYYDTNNILVSTVTFKDGEINGKSVDLFKNGKIHKESEYSYGEKNGVSKIYDSTGKLIAIKNFYHDLEAGPQVLYRGDSVYLYKFVNLENLDLYSCKYENEEAKERGNILNYITHYIQVDNQKELQLFIFLVNPPHKIITYQIFDKDFKNNDSILLKELTYQGEFFKKITFELPADNHKYIFKVKAFYPNEKVTVDNIITNEEREMRMPDAKL